MLRVYYAYLPLDYQRPGGVWWFRDLFLHEVDAFIKIIRPVATAIRTSDCLIPHDLTSIEPPEDATKVL